MTYHPCEYVGMTLPASVFVGHRVYSSLIRMLDQTKNEQLFPMNIVSSYGSAVSLRIVDALFTAARIIHYQNELEHYHTLVVYGWYYLLKRTVCI